MNTFSNVKSVIFAILLFSLCACQKTPAAPTSSVAAEADATVAERTACAIISPQDGHLLACIDKERYDAQSCDVPARLGGAYGVLVESCAEGTRVDPAELANEAAASEQPPTATGCACAQYQTSACMVWIWGEGKSIAWTEDSARGCDEQVCNELVAEFKVGQSCPAPRYLDPLELSNMAPTD